MKCARAWRTDRHRQQTRHFLTPELRCKFRRHMPCKAVGESLRLGPSLPSGLGSQNTCPGSVFRACLCARDVCCPHMLASCSTQHCRVRVSIECGRRAFMAFALRHSPAPRRRYQIVSSSLTTCRHLSPPVPRPLRRSPGYLRGVLPLTERALTHGEPRVAPAIPGTVACRLHVFRESLDDALIAQIRRRALMERAPVRARAMAAHVAAGTELSAEATREPPGERCVTGRRWQGWRWRSSTARLRCLVTPRRLL